jgi:endonuclease/exonuclease/phosphatase family metal-dependent hydrolase
VITAPVPIALAVVSRRWLAAILAAASLASLAGIVVPRAFGHPDPPRGPAVRVMSANMYEGHADPAALVQLVRTQRVDVLAVEELTGFALDRLTASGLGDLLPYQEPNPRGWASGTGLFSRYPLDGADRRELSDDFVETIATVRVPGAVPVVVTAVHYCAPAVPGEMGCWRQGVDTVPPATPGGAVRVLLGDFNLTVDFAALRRILATGYRDAAQVVGEGLTPTWRYRGLVQPRVTIDHVLADRRVGISSVSVSTEVTTARCWPR